MDGVVLVPDENRQLNLSKRSYDGLRLPIERVPKTAIGLTNSPRSLFRHFHSHDVLLLSYRYV